MRTIVIAGSRSNIGKTSLAETLLQRLTSWSALKVTVRTKSGCPRQRNDCGVCAKFKGDFNIITHKKIINQQGTDTSRLKKAGAVKVVWLKASLNGLRRGLKKALNQLRDSEGVVIEGTSVLKYIKPTMAIYLKDDAGCLKPSAKQAYRKADLVIDVNR